MLKTKADDKLPAFKKPPDQPGKYTWTEAIERDLLTQVGLRPVYARTVGSQFEFLDVHVWDPAKMENLGFMRFEKREKLQMIYLENSCWEIQKHGQKLGSVLCYQSATWTVDKEHPETAAPVEDPEEQQSVKIPENLWELTAKRQGDQIVEESKMERLVEAHLSTNDTFDKIAVYYKEDLMTKGWTQGTLMINENQGVLMMTKGNATFILRSENRTGHTEEKRFYHIMLQLP